MGVLDDLTRSFGPEALEPTTGVGTGPHNWQLLCTCGHLRRYHSEDIGGAFVLASPIDKTLGDGRQFSYRQRFTGCRGAMVSRGVPTAREENDTAGDPVTRIEILLPTCPCTKFREVAKVDRPNRYFNQRVPDKKDDPLRHPMTVGLRAMSTFLSRRRRALSDPSWAAAEADRRFEWTHRRCALSKCEETDDVWAVFINSDGDSELRCSKHR